LKESHDFLAYIFKNSTFKCCRRWGGNGMGTKKKKKKGFVNVLCNVFEREGQQVYFWHFQGGQFPVTLKRIFFVNWNTQRSGYCLRIHYLKVSLNSRCGWLKDNFSVVIGRLSFGRWANCLVNSKEAGVSARVIRL